MVKSDGSSHPDPLARDNHVLLTGKRGPGD